MFLVFVMGELLMLVVFWDDCVFDLGGFVVKYCDCVVCLVCDVDVVDVVVVGVCLFDCFGC